MQRPAPADTGYQEWGGERGAQSRDEGSEGVGRGLASLCLLALAEPSTEQELSLNELQTSQTAWPVFRGSFASFTKFIELSHEKHLNFDLRHIEISFIFLFLLKRSQRLAARTAA